MPWLETISACLPKPSGESRTIFYWNKVLEKEGNGKKVEPLQKCDLFSIFCVSLSPGWGRDIPFPPSPSILLLLYYLSRLWFSLLFFWISERSFCVRYCIHSNRFFINQHNFSCTTIHNQKSYSTENNNIITLSYHVLISKWLHTISYFVQHSFVILF